MSGDREEERAQRVAERRRKDELARWRGPRPVATIIRSSDITACPTRRMDPPHFRPDGTCMCLPPRDETLEPHIVKGDQ